MGAGPEPGQESVWAACCGWKSDWAKQGARVIILCLPTLNVDL